MTAAQAVLKLGAHSLHKAYNPKGQAMSPHKPGTRPGLAQLMWLMALSRGHAHH